MTKLYIPSALLRIYANYGASSAPLPRPHHHTWPHQAPGGGRAAPHRGVHQAADPTRPGPLRQGRHRRHAATRYTRTWVIHERVTILYSETLILFRRQAMNDDEQ